MRGAGAEKRQMLRTNGASAWLRALRITCVYRKPDPSCCKDLAVHGIKIQSLRQMPSMDIKLVTKDQDLSFQ